MLPTLHTESSSYWLSVSLLNEITVTLHTSDGLSRRVPISPNAERLQLLAYLAWKRGQDVSEQEIFKTVFFPRLIEEMMPEKASWPLWRFPKVEQEVLKKKARKKFDDGKKLLRKNIRTVVTHINAEREPAHQLKDIDPFEHRSRWRWRISSLWHVTDVDSIETLNRVIREAEHHGNARVSEAVKAACDALIATYPGDFLEQMLRTYPEEFRPRVRSWVREPYTYYRERYVQALWYAACYELEQSQVSTDEQHTWHHSERAASLFRQCAMYACNSRLDTNVYFREAPIPSGFSVWLSEDAVNHCLTIYKAHKREQDFQDTYSAYIRQMKRVSHNQWEPSDKLRAFELSINS